MGEEKEKFVRAVADRVKKHGFKFEEVLRERERDNPKFAFLRNVDVSAREMLLGVILRSGV